MKNKKSFVLGMLAAALAFVAAGTLIACGGGKSVEQLEKEIQQIAEQMEELDATSAADAAKLAKLLEQGTKLAEQLAKAEAKAADKPAKAPKASGKESPASDFSYDLAEGGAGVVITAYTGNGGKVVIPAKIEGLPVVEIGGGAFNAERGERGYNMTSVVIPAGVKKIGPVAFNECEKLTSVTIQGSEVTLAYSAFYKCVELAELNIPDGDKALIPAVDQYGSVETDAFRNCKKLPLAMRSRLNAMGFTSI